MCIAYFNFGICLLNQEVDLISKGIQKAENINGKEIDDFLLSEFGVMRLNSDNCQYMLFEASNIYAMLGIPAVKFPDPYEAAYASEDEVVEEFKQRLGKWLPEDFDYSAHIGWYSYTM